MLTSGFQNGILTSSTWATSGIALTSVCSNITPMHTEEEQGAYVSLLHSKREVTPPGRHPTRRHPTGRHPPLLQPSPSHCCHLLGAEWTPDNFPRMGFVFLELWQTMTTCFRTSIEDTEKGTIQYYLVTHCQIIKTEEITIRYLLKYVWAWV